MYYAQYDVLEDLSKGKKWSFVEVRPDGVVSHISPHRSLSSGADLIQLPTVWLRSLQ
jgi:hypothetical protein